MTASVSAFLAGITVGLWVPLIYFSGMSGGVAVAAHVSRKRKAITGAPMPEYAPAHGAETWRGVVHALSGKTLAASGGPEGAVVEQLTLRDKHGALLLRRIYAVPFVMEREDAERVVVAGEVRVIAGPPSDAAVSDDDARIRRMGVPAGLIKKAHIEVRVVREGDAVEVAGLGAEELVPDLAFHRDGGQVTVVRGRRGALALIHSTVVAPAS